jgi:hypothetical protein
MRTALGSTVTDGPTLASQISQRQFQIPLNDLNFDLIPIAGILTRFQRQSFRWIALGLSRAFHGIHVFG